MLDHPSDATRDFDLAGFITAIQGVPVIDNPGQVRLKSKDYSWFSPILKDILRDKHADIVVCPRNEEDVLRIARAAVRHRVPITARGGGTGNYGQATPLNGGAVIDMTALNAIQWVKPGKVRVQAGIKLIDIDNEVRKSGWELRMHPSTKRMATVGGFVAGGSGGVGSVNHGYLRELGNVLGARVVTFDNEPRIIELRDTDTLTINHAFGTTGIVTELEMPLAAAWPWFDVIIAVDDFAKAVRIGHRLALADGLVKKLVTPIAWPIPSYFTHFKSEFPRDRSCVIAMIAEPSLSPLKSLVAAEGGDIPYCVPTEEEGPDSRPLYECTWNHTTLHALKFNRKITYLQSLYPADRLEESIAEIRALFPEELMPHLEFIRYAGRVQVSGLHLIRYTTAARVKEIFAMHEARGVMIADPHVFTLEDGTRHRGTDADQLSFKRKVDPYGLLNPGKMRGFTPAQ
jgi:FAD/FMN-containing dehydrogenase